MSDDKEQPENDGLDALASGLEANESDDADDDVDLASLAAVVGARASSVTSVAGADSPAADGAEKLVLNTFKAAEPKSPEPRSERSWLVPTLVAFAVGVGAMGYVLGRSSRPEDSAVPPSAVAPSAIVPKDSAPPSPSVVLAVPPIAAPSVPPHAAEPSEPAPAATVAQSPIEARAARAPARPSDATAKPAPIVAAAPPSGQPASSPSPGPVEPAQAGKPGEPAALAKAESGPSRSVDDLLDEALASPSERRAAQALQATELPEAPSREEVTQAMAVLLPAIRGCAMGQSGLATAGIVVRGDGRVASVELSGAPFEGTASGRCMEGVLRRARFARFKQPTFRVRFPFSIQ